MLTETIKEVEEDDDNSSTSNTEDEIVDMDELSEQEAEDNEVPLDKK